MANYSQPNLLIPVIITLGKSGKPMTTEELYPFLTSMLSPWGDDLNHYAGRSDTVFSQTIRNFTAPERLSDFNKKFVTSIDGKLSLTDFGWRVYNAIFSTQTTVRPRIGDENLPIQIIFFGTPGSGKSKKVERDILPKDEKLVFRTTFHPDTDYSSFVGCYKPKMDGDKIKYEFSTQVFMDAYIAAWKNLEIKYYLVIEEINRGNCAQIFGDLFQLLDRDKDTGYSEYPVKADKDLQLYLETLCKEEKLDEGAIKEGKLKLPPNLNIIATMNTSDQSLFPMDSAFKRRWDWEYVPIEYDNPDSAKFNIRIDGQLVKWHEFLKNVNEKIKQATASEDKQMGNFFIKKSLNEKEFCDKVMFYLWSEVGKDNYKTTDALFKWRDEKDEDHDFTFSELYASDEDRNNLLKGFICFINDESRKNTETAVDINKENSENDAE